MVVQVGDSHQFPDSEENVQAFCKRAATVFFFFFPFLLPYTDVAFLSQNLLILEYKFKSMLHLYDFQNSNKNDYLSLSWLQSYVLNLRNSCGIFK